jgi:poly(A) polymerase
MKLLEHRRFRAAYDFMVLRAEVGLESEETAQFWTDVQTLSAAERADRFQLGQPGSKKRRSSRRRRRKKPAQES